MADNKQFANVPSGKQAAMERCVLKLKNDPKFKPQKGRTREQSAIAVCFQSVVRGKDLGELIEMNSKERRKKRRRETRALNRAKEKQDAGEDLSHEEQTALAKASFKEEQNISQEEAAAEVIAAIGGETEKIEVTEDIEDVLEFSRKEPAIVLVLYP